MKVITDAIQRIHLIDNDVPYNSIIFDVYSEMVAVYQDSNDDEIREKFEQLDETVDFSKDELIAGLEEVIRLLKEGV